MADPPRAKPRPEGAPGDTAGEVEAARAALAGVAYDALVLDLGLPDGDGLNFLAELRRAKRQFPVLILSARGRADQRVAGLKAGADDYLAKPFDVEELVARIQALLRRPAALAGATLGLGNLAVDVEGQVAKVDGKDLKLTRRELGVLGALPRRPGQIVSRAQLEDALYGFGDEIASNAIEVYVSALRKRLTEAGADCGIETQRGLGYKLALKPQR
ncbi:MAG: response regulator transcription factor [Alphaproteobacteria bacterium]|nr:response regulator transcription factor [Alphaproteobacteria bacterium]